MLFRTNSVHGFGMREPLVVVFLDTAGVVIGVADVLPGTVVRHLTATWSLELPAGAGAPIPGDRLVLTGAESPSSGA